MIPGPMVVNAPAKLNFHLRVVGRRPDGYHLLLTWMVRLELVDRLLLNFDVKGIELEVRPLILPMNEENLVFRAAELFYRAAGLEPGVGILLEKKIPVAAGMGGGSSDAASTLNALNQAHGGPFDPAGLAELGLSLGADVPFFLQPHASAWAEGIGERLREGPKISGKDVLIVNPGWPLSTAWVFKNFNLELTSTRRNHIFSGSYESSFTIDGTMTNDLEQVVLPRFPEVGRIKGLLMDAGAAAAMMTGSGPTVFGVFNTKEEAVRARDYVQANGGDEWMVLQTKTQ